MQEREKVPDPFADDVPQRLPAGVTAVENTPSGLKTPLRERLALRALDYPIPPSAPSVGACARGQTSRLPIGYETVTSTARLQLHSQRCAAPQCEAVRHRADRRAGRNRDIDASTSTAACAHASRGSRLRRRSISPCAGRASTASSSAWESRHGWCLWQPYLFISGR